MYIKGVNLVGFIYIIRHGARYTECQDGYFTLPKRVAAITFAKIKFSIYCFYIYFFNPFQASDAMWHHTLHLSLIFMSFAQWFQYVS